MKQNRKYYLLLFLLVAGLILFGMRPGVLFGSSTDWLNQHTVFPDYFRNLFYETGNLFSNFAFHIGGGQNIFHFAYYGLWNPLLLPSFLLPFIKMTTYIQAINIFSIFASTYLCFYWLKKKQIKPNDAFLATCFFCCASPLIYQAHRHFMFIDYMPFLFLGLIGIDQYLKKRSKALVSISIFLMIMTSYYYSIGGLFVLAIYYIYAYLKQTEWKLSTFLKDGLRFLFPYFLGILMAMFLLLPTIYVVLNGRTGNGSEISTLSLFLPQFDYKNFLYDGYGLGLTILTLIAIFGGIFAKQKEHKFLSISCMIIGLLPIFMYLLNGTLYIRGKVLIPFLPLAILLLALFFQNLEEKKDFIRWKNYLILLPILGGVALLLHTHKVALNIAFALDLLGTTIGLWYFFKTKNTKIYYFFLLIAIVTDIIANQTENYVTIQKYQTIEDKEIQEAIETIQAKDPSWYRMKQLNQTLATINKVYNINYYQPSLYSSTQNKYYRDFYNTYLGNAISNRNNLMLSSNRNLLFDTFMGTRYVLGEEDSLGYEKVFEKGNVVVYQNTNALPLLYATSHLYPKSAFEQQEFPYQTDLLLRNAIVDENVQPKDTSTIRKVNPSFTIESVDGLTIKETKNQYHLEASKKVKTTLHLNQDFTGKILLLQFKITNEVGCEYKDRAITIDQKVNKLTCKDWIYANNNYQFQYVLAKRENNQNFEIIIDPGVYEIASVEFYEMDDSIITDLNQQIDPFQLDIKNQKNDQIKGTIEVQEDGYFVTSIPYDRGFTIEIDGEKVKTEMVNQAFLGCKIKKGAHHMKITYHSPYFKEGCILSGIGFTLWIGVVLFDVHKKRTRKK